jgi:hypothetical protein
MQQRSGDLVRLSGAEVDIAFTGISTGGAAIPDSPFSRMMSQVVVNWSEARRWGRAPLRKPAAGSAYNPFALSSNWVRVTIQSEGLYAIGRSDLSIAGVDVASVDPGSFRLFTRGGKPLPTSNSAPADSLTEIAIHVEDVDGIFSGADKVLFYAHGSDFWEWDDSLIYHQHPYDIRNVYYLTWGGDFGYPPRRMQTLSAITDAADTVEQFVDFIHLEENRHLYRRSGIVNDYFTWYWQTNQVFSLNFNLPAGIGGAENELRVRAFAGDVDAILNGEILEPEFAGYPDYVFRSTALSAGLNQLDISLTPYFSRTLTDYLEIKYRRPLSLPDGGQLVFNAEPGAEPTPLVGYSITNVDPQATYVVDVTDRFNQRLPSVGDTVGTSNVIFAPIGSDIGRRFAVASQAALYEPVSMVVTEIADLRSPANQADLVMIVHDQFYNHALEFAAYRQEQNQLTARVVKISDVYAQFSGGLVDPVAIRDFLRFTYFNWTPPAPSYCLLVGDGVYDFRD